MYSNIDLRYDMRAGVYLLDIIDMKYIDLEKSHISQLGGAVFRIDVDRLPKYPYSDVSSQEVLRQTLFDMAFNSGNGQTVKVIPNENDEYSIIMDFLPEKCSLSFVVRHNNIPMLPHNGYITDMMEYMKELDSNRNSRYYHCKKGIRRFVQEANNYIKEQIRNKFFLENVKGSFVSDDIRGDTYFQRRSTGDKKIWYVIYNWQRHLLNGSVQWADIDNGEGSMYAALID